MSVDNNLRRADELRSRVLVKDAAREKGRAPPASRFSGVGGKEFDVAEDDAFSSAKTTGARMGSVAALELARVVDPELERAADRRQAASSRGAAVSLRCSYAQNCAMDVVTDLRSTIGSIMSHASRGAGTPSSRRRT